MANNVDYSQNSPNYTAAAQVRAAYGYPRTIDWITIHWWGDPSTNPTIEGVVSWFTQTRSQVSAHDIITGSGNRVFVMVNYGDAAWHAGNALGNASSLGFECDPRCRPEDYEAVSQDIAETWKYYGRIIPLRKHSSWKQTACPGNYDLDRLYNRAVEIYNGAPVVTPPTPAPITEVSREVFNPLKQFKTNKDTRLYNIIPGNVNGSNVYANGTIVDIKQLLTLSDGRKYYRTEYSSDKELATGFRAEDLVDQTPPPVVVPPVVVQPEWVRNLNDITDVKLTVLKAEGTPVINLATLEVLPSTIIPKGTQVDIAKETTVGGVKYLITSYSATKGVANGILASDLGTPAVDPIVEKPEWLKNLNDITDKDVWTRSETPILTLADGTVAKTVPINTKIRITKATEVLGQDLLVLDGDKYAIETVYASDTEIKNPTTDVEQRLSVLEAIVKAISDFLSSIFKGFKAQ